MTTAAPGELTPEAVGHILARSGQTAAVGLAAMIGLIAPVPGGLSGAASALPPVLSEGITASHLPHTLVRVVEGSAEATTATSIRALHERTGLTWDEVARMFGVSRRTVHNWADGARLSSARERRLHQLADIVTDVSGSPAAFRSALRGVAGGRSVIDIIALGAPPALVRAHLAERLGSGGVTVATRLR